MKDESKNAIWDFLKESLTDGLKNSIWLLVVFVVTWIVSQINIGDFIKPIVSKSYQLSLLEIVVVLIMAISVYPHLKSYLDKIFKKTFSKPDKHELQISTKLPVGLGFIKLDGTGNDDNGSYASLSVLTINNEGKEELSHKEKCYEGDERQIAISSGTVIAIVDDVSNTENDKWIKIRTWILK